MAGISDKAIKGQYAANKYRYNGGTELANGEFTDGTGLEMYETDFRGYDPQIGRFWQIDPFGELFEEWSSYSFAFDNPIVYNDPLGLDPEEANKSGDKKKTHKHKHKDRSGPLHETLQEVVVVGHRKVQQSHSSRTVTAAPPNQAPPINWLGWSNSTSEDRKEWKRDQYLFLDRVRADQVIIQGGESYHYLHSITMYEQWRRADHESRIMQFGAITIVLGPPAAAEVLWAADLGGISESWLNFNTRLWYEGQYALNSTTEELILAIRQALGSRLTIDQAIRLEKLAHEYRDLNKFVKDVKRLRDFYINIKKVIGP